MPTYKILLRCLYQIQTDPNLPAFKPTARELTRLCQKSDVSMDEVLDVVQLDETLAAKFLEIANSPIFLRGEPAVTIKDALIRIGLDEVRRTGVLLVISELIKKIQTAEDPLQFWLHSVLSARFAERSARDFEVAPEKAYIAGLMHDIGKRFLQSYFPDEFAEVTLGQTGSSFNMEEQSFDTNHAEIGYILALRWSFNSEVAIAIRRHHRTGQDVLAKCVRHGSDLARRAQDLSVNTEAPEEGSEDEALLKEYNEVMDLVSRMFPENEPDSVPETLN